jgi:DNA-binding CsgD family transcriptional regulator
MLTQKATDLLRTAGLSGRELEVAQLVATGLSNKEVASQLYVSEKTVKFHLTNIFKKTNTKSRSQFIVYTVTQGQ